MKVRFVNQVVMASEECKYKNAPWDTNIASDAGRDLETPTQTAPKSVKSHLLARSSSQSCPTAVNRATKSQSNATGENFISSSKSTERRVPPKKRRRLATWSPSTAAERSQKIDGGSLSRSQLAAHSSYAIERWLAESNSEGMNTTALMHLEGMLSQESLSWSKITQEKHTGGRSNLVHKNDKVSWNYWAAGW